MTQTQIVSVGVSALALLAFVLWRPRIVELLSVADIIETIPDAPPEPTGRRVPTFDGGRTTIAPKITDAAIRRIRGI